MAHTDDSYFDFCTTCDTDDSDFDLRTSCGPDDSSRCLLGCAHLTTGRPIGASRAIGWCGTRLLSGSSASDTDPWGYRLPLIQALHLHHSLSHPEITLGCHR
jgi:hypothetical protein